MNKQVKKLDYTGQQVFVGFDVHKENWKVATCTEHTNPSVWPVTMKRPFVQNMKRYLDKHFPGGEFVCGYEAGFCGFWIVEEMHKVGLSTLVLHAADIPTTDKERKQKEDKRDARKIAKALKHNDLMGIYVPAKQEQADRSLVRERYSLAKSLRRVKGQIKSHMALYNIEAPDDIVTTTWSRNFIDWLSKECTRRNDIALAYMLKRLKQMHQLLLDANKSLHAVAKQDRHKELYSILRSAPGVGPLTAMLLITEIVDMKRFTCFEDLCSYTGFIPTMAESADNDRKGSLTNRRNIRLRTALVESSWTAIKRDPELLLKYECYRKRMTAQRAIVRISRILLRRIRHIWLHKERYIKAEI